jgi:hypothetical protein
MQPSQSAVLRLTAVGHLSLRLSLAQKIPGIVRMCASQFEVCRAGPHSQRKSQAMIDSSGSNSEMQKFESSRPSQAVGSL